MTAAGFVNPFSLMHDFFFCAFVMVSVMYKDSLRPEELSLCAFAEVAPLTLQWCMVLPCLSSAVLTPWLTHIVSEDLGCWQATVLQISAVVTGCGVGGLLLIPRCIFDPHQSCVTMALIGANCCHLLLLLLLPRLNLSKGLFIPQITASLACMYYDLEDRQESFGFLAGEALWVYSSQKFLLAILFPVAKQRRPNLLFDWATMVVPLAVLVLNANSGLTKWCQENSNRKWS